MLQTEPQIERQETEFEIRRKQGLVIENAIVRWLRSRGNGVVTVYEIEHNNGKGPRFFSSFPADEVDDMASQYMYVAPDIAVFSGAGNVLFCEAKCKTTFTWYYTKRRWTTGIDLHHYRDYQKVAEKTGLPVWLLFYHASEYSHHRDIQHGAPDHCPTGLYGGDLAYLAEHESHRSEKHGRHGMVYWAEDDLKLLASREEVYRPQVRDQIELF